MVFFDAHLRVFLTFRCFWCQRPVIFERVFVVWWIFVVLDGKIGWRSVVRKREREKRTEEKKKVIITLRRARIDD